METKPWEGFHKSLDNCLRRYKISYIVHWIEASFKTETINQLSKIILIKHLPSQTSSEGLNQKAQLN
jgi:hypothetical protein